MTVSSTWLFPLRKAGDGHSARLLVFPYAASGPTSLRPVVTLLPASVELLGVALPGRERRFGEPLRTTVDDVVRGIGSALDELQPLPTFLLGHSMGASLALAFALSRPGRCAGVAVSGSKPRSAVLDSLNGLTDHEVTSFLGALGSTRSQLLDDPFWSDHLVKLFRHDNDLDVAASSALRSGQLREPLLVLGGADDPYVTPGDLAEWADHTTGGAEVSVFPGGHFFLLDPTNVEPVAAALADLTCGNTAARKEAHLGRSPRVS
ncbi:thioesterase II family protein [Streptomyces sp. NPDC059651]|uniref:thioesterase II family protein n=1 Tax=Streptomyces sp. NPDC059651 TaxID=3346897 RepID=UPI003686DAC8